MRSKALNRLTKAGNAVGTVLTHAYWRLQCFHAVNSAASAAACDAAVGSAVLPLKSNTKVAKQDWLLLQADLLFCKMSLQHCHCLAFSSALSLTAIQAGSYRRDGEKGK